MLSPKNKLNFIIISALMLMSLDAFSDEKKPTTDYHSNAKNPTEQEHNNGVILSTPLSQINADIVLFDALTEREKAKWKLERAKRGEFDNQVGQVVPGGNGFGQNSQLVLPAPVNSDKTNLPELLGVYGVNNNLKATLRLPGGSTVEALPGDSFPGGLLIKSISINKVVVSIQGKLYSLGS